MTNHIKLLHNVIMELRNTKGSNAKKDVLKRHFEVIPLELSEFLMAVYDPRRSYYQTELKMGALPRMLLGKIEPKETLQDIYRVLNQMNNKEYLGQKGAQELCRVAHALSPEGQELVQIILNRDIKAGLAEKSINKAWADAGHKQKLINTIPYQRYGDMTIAALKKMDFGAGVFSQLKSDGMFGNVIMQTGKDPQIISRSGSPITGPSVQPLLDYVLDTSLSAGVGNFVLHGELLVLDTTTNSILPRAVGNGMLNTVIQTGSAIDSRYLVEYRAWDIVNYDDWFNSVKITTPYDIRWGLLQDMFSHDDGTTLLYLQESRIVHSFGEAVDHLKEVLARREEGTIWKPIDMPWEDGTSEYGIKGKLVMDCDLKVVGFNAGDKKGKHANTFGSIQMESSDGLLKVGVSGMPDAVRKAINANRDEYLGKIWAVLSNGVQDKRDDPIKSLFLPRLAEHEPRLDKIEADTLDKIYEIQQSTIDNIQKLLEE